MSSDDEAPESFSIKKGKENFFDELKEKKNAINIQKQQKKDLNRQRQIAQEKSATTKPKKIKEKVVAENLTVVSTSSHVHKIVEEEKSEYAKVEDFLQQQLNKRKRVNLEAFRSQKKKGPASNFVKL